MILFLFILVMVLPTTALAQSVNIRNGNAPGIAGVMNSAPVGTEYGLVVRCLGCSGSAGLTDAQLRATPVPVSGAFSLPSNASQETGGNLAILAAKDFATSAKQDTENTSLASIDAKVPKLYQNTMPVAVVYSLVPVAPVIPPGANRLQYSALMQGYCRQVLCPPLPGGLR